VGKKSLFLANKVGRQCQQSLATAKISSIVKKLEPGKIEK
jgi:hypothetical protein